MGLRFRKTLTIIPGIRINLSKTGGSLSIGRRGATVNVGKRGTYVDVGAPGTGVSYRQKIGGPNRAAGSRNVSRRTVWLAFGLLALFVVLDVIHHWPTHLASYVATSKCGPKWG